ncbi:hypothetical protein [Swaminathania salitolerans]|uniref:Uncharacterized protein n=1 Tax=Swaminathania salitolerans TaxID=182838 RepID=A0A511BSP4_9PROT|nr:hypothetical protein [Swaminathania salitolerans]GBQ12678.1 hypothetical protein AA21291_1264 [Swaminathania salitolerans LMG 21291]GEL03132.1 hypothetical protein SSA02_22950 [Swaminathania salitolerans]
MEVPTRPSLTRLATSSEDRATPPASGLTLIRTAFWAVCYFVFYFAQQVAEILAPLCLVIGIGWMALPRALAAITTGPAASDPQAIDVMNHVVGSIPQRIAFAGHVLTPGGLVFDGVLLMALAALGATIAAVASRNM